MGENLVISLDPWQLASVMDGLKAIGADGVLEVVRQGACKPQGVYCCPGVLIRIDASDVDQTITYIQGQCPECGATWVIEKEEA